MPASLSNLFLHELLLSYSCLHCSTPASSVKHFHGRTLLQGRGVETVIIIQNLAEMPVSMRSESTPHPPACNAVALRVGCWQGIVPRLVATHVIPGFEGRLTAWFPGERFLIDCLRHTSFPAALRKSLRSRIRRRKEASVSGLE